MNGDYVLLKRESILFLDVIKAIEGAGASFNYRYKMSIITLMKDHTNYYYNS